MEKVDLEKKVELEKCAIEIIDGQLHCDCQDAESADKMQKLLEKGVLVKVKAVKAI